MRVSLAARRAGEDKVAISRQLIALGVSYVEGGWPGSNPKDGAFFERWGRELAADAAASGTKLAAFGSTRRRGTTAAEDAGCQALLACGAPCVTLVAKAWDEQVKRSSACAHFTLLHALIPLIATHPQVEKVLGTSLEENLAMISDSVAFFKSHGREVALDLEHFFDGAAANADYAAACVRAGSAAGADCLVLCDTNGGSMPWEVEARTAAAAAEAAAAAPPGAPRPRLGIHCHNDGGLAVANSLAAVRGGAAVIQGCVNGYGERTGNADLIALAGNLELKLQTRCLPAGRLARLTDVSRAVAALCRVPHAAAQPYAGAAAFAHKGGLHVAALAKMPASYNHIPPERVGNAHRSVVSELSGRGNVQAAAAAAGLPPLADDAVAAVLAQIKALEHDGASFEAAGASVEMLILRASPAHASPFHVREFNVHCHNRSFAAAGDAPAALPPGAAAGYKAGSQAVNTAIVKLELPGGDIVLEAAEGNGPVNALALALRGALAPRYPALAGIRLRDYKVDLLGREGTSAAVTRVTIDFSGAPTGAGGEQPSWRTVGAHSSIIEASFRALVDGLEWAIAHCDADSCDAGFGDKKQAQLPPL